MFHRSSWWQSLRVLCLALASLLYSTESHGQSVDPVIIGYVRDCRSGEPLEAVAVQLLNSQRGTTSDALGNFRLSVPAGNQQLHIQMVGRHSFDTLMLVVAGSQVFINVRLCPSSLYLDELLVTSEEQSIGSSSILTRSAIEHVQAVSVFDALQLLPGQLAINPDLSGPQQVLLRQASTSAAANRASALGTSIVVDGAPISNNANMQMNNTILNSPAGSAPPFASVSGQGIDLRQIPADQIERIEVIRGIPSSRYGDATAGMIIITSKSGVYAPNYRFRVNPTLIQNALGAGFKAGSSTINYDADLTAARDDPRDDVNRYQRLNQQVAWTNRLLADGSLNTSIRISYYRTVDELKNKSADTQLLSERYARDENLRLNANLKWTAARKFLESVSLNVTGSYGKQSSWFQDLITRDIFPISTAVTDTTQAGVYGKSEYLNQTRVEGKPAGIYSRLEFQHVLTTQDLSHQIVTGTEWRSEGNRARGRQFDVITPPRQNYSVGERPRSYYNVPYMHQASFYSEDRMLCPIGSAELTAIAGGRVDIYRTSDWRAVFSPRLNASLRLSRGVSVRVGYGHTAKMPTLSYLYPSPTFYDLVNFNYYAANPAERLVMMTTRKLVPDTDQIGAYKARKTEGGIDYTEGNAGFTFAVFSERTTGAYQYQRDLKNLLVEKFEAVAYPSGSPPVLASVPIRIDTFMAAYDRPVNSLEIRTVGGEFTFNVSDWPLRRATVNLTGGYFRTHSKNQDEFLNTDQAVFSNQASGRVGVFAAGQGQVSERFSTAARFIYHLSSFGLIASSLVQTIWIDNSKLADYSELPVGFFNRRGEIIRLSEEQAGHATYSDLKRNIDPLQLEWQRRPPMWLFNVRLAKEWKPRNGLAFYVNNLLNTNPLFVSSLTGYRQERSQPDLFFGAEIYLSF